MNSRTENKVSQHHLIPEGGKGTNEKCQLHSLNLPKPTRYIGLKEMCELTGKSHPTLWRMWAKLGDFPKPHRTKSGSFLGWPVQVDEEWVAECDPKRSH